MSKTGTCRWTHQIQEMWRIRGGLLDYSHPHTPKAAEHVVMPDGQYTCQWLDQYGRDSLPPAIKRYNGAFQLRDGDCDACPHYVPAALHLLK